MSVQETTLKFFFDTVQWVFNEFLIEITVLDVPILYYFVALILFSILIGGIVNTAHSSYDATIRATRELRKLQEKESNKHG